MSPPSLSWRLTGPPQTQVAGFGRGQSEAVALGCHGERTTRGRELAGWHDEQFVEALDSERLDPAFAAGLGRGSTHENLAMAKRGAATSDGSWRCTIGESRARHP
jgi:hypothetical protein